MIVSNFFVFNKDSRERFFEKNFLLANIKLDIVLEMLFLTLNNANVILTLIFELGTYNENPTLLEMHFQP